MKSSLTVSKEASRTQFAVKQNQEEAESQKDEDAVLILTVEKNVLAIVSVEVSFYS